MNTTPKPQSLVIAPTGAVRGINLAGTSRGRLDQMYEQLACRYVDVVRLTVQVDMWIDDEGLYSQPPNPVATALARRFGYIYQPYFGAVLLCSINENGDSIDLTADQVSAMLSHLADITDGARR